MLKNSRKVALIICALSVFGLGLGTFSGEVQAVPLTIGQSLVSGGTTFTLLDCTYDTGACPGVTPFEFVANGLDGIKITGPGGGTLITGTGPSDIHDLYVLFEADGFGISGIALYMNGTGDATVAENISDIDFCGGPAACLTANLYTTADAPTDSTNFAAHNAIYFDKDINTGSIGSIEYVTQEITRVPEPSTLTLMSTFALLGGGYFRRQKRREKRNCTA